MAAMAGMQDLPFPLLAGGEHLGDNVEREGRWTLDCGVGEEPKWECTLWGELCPPVCDVCDMLFMWLAIHVM